MLNRIFGILLVTFMTVGFVADVNAQGKAPKRSFVKVTGDVYRYQNNFHFGMAVETKDSVVVTDPINSDMVKWLRVEIKKRFNKPVSHAIYSHSHGDHNTGGEEWGKGVEVVAHAGVREQVLAGKARTGYPTTVFDDELIFRIGGKTFELKYLGVGHGTDLIATVVRPENVAFIVDLASKDRVPFRNFPRTDIDGLIKQIKTAEALKFKTLIPGHGGVGTHADLKSFRVYIETLIKRVAAGLKAGKSTDDLVKSVTMSEYKNWDAYKFFRKANVQGMAAWLQKQSKM
jgi:glyoxylase-like metal-dependent hydrolase (beta-lactamase superfamily II)